MNRRFTVTRFLRRRHHPILWMLLVLVVLIALQLVLRLWPLLLAARAVRLVCRLWQPRRRAVTQATRTAPPLRLVQGDVISEDPEARRLRAENAKLRTKVRVLSEFINGPAARP
jgi:hypothetical protein